MSRRRLPKCPDTLYGDHGPADRDGNCPWCGLKYTNALSAPRGTGEATDSEAYRYHYDPDYGVGRYDDYE